MADGAGFEPAYDVTHNTLSKRAPSATRPPILTIYPLVGRVGCLFLLSFAIQLFANKPLLQN